MFLIFKGTAKHISSKGSSRVFRVMLQEGVLYYRCVDARLPDVRQLTALYTASSALFHWSSHSWSFLRLHQLGTSLASMCSHHSLVSGCLSAALHCSLFASSLQLWYAKHRSPVLTYSSSRLHVLTPQSHGNNNVPHYDPPQALRQQPKWRHLPGLGLSVSPSTAFAPARPGQDTPAARLRSTLGVILPKLHDHPGLR